MHAMGLLSEDDARGSKLKQGTYPGTWDGRGRTTQWQPCCARWSAGSKATQQGTKLIQHRWTNAAQVSTAQRALHALTAHMSFSTYKQATYCC
jgi:hypothetical protein